MRQKYLGEERERKSFRAQIVEKEEAYTHVRDRFCFASKEFVFSVRSLFLRSRTANMKTVFFSKKNPF